MSDPTSIPVALVRGPIVASVRSINNEATPSVAFAYLSAKVRSHGYPVTVVDGIAGGLGRFQPLPDYPGYQITGLGLDEIVARIPGNTRVIGISAMFSGEWPVMRDLIGKIRARFPEALLIGGGEHITALTEYSLRDCPALDVCVRGEGEATLVAVLDAFRTGGSMAGIAGVAVLDAAGTYVCGEGVPRVRDIDSLPWPTWEEGYLERFWQIGKSYGIHTDRDMPIMASRGCPYRCTFCSNAQMWTTRYILRDPDDLLAEIESYVARYNITSLQFYDLTAITKKRWTVEFCRKLMARGIKLKWSLPSGTRSEALDEETLALLKDTGCTYLVYAPESGSPRTLERIKKKIDLKQFTRSVMTAKRVGLVLRTNLIIGFPGETRWDVLRTVVFGLGLAARGVDEVSINIFSAYPGTEIFKELLDAGKIVLDDAYFLRLTSLNSDYTAFNPLTFNERMGPRELATYRLFFMLANYALGYLLYPSRILRTIRNLRAETGASTVLEHRLKDLLRRRAQG